MRRFDVTDPDERDAGMRAGAAAVEEGELVVLPTDTVYGIGADAFTPTAVRALLRAKGRGPDMPVPVLVGTPGAARALVESMPPSGERLAEAFWPGALTVVCRHSASLAWDLGETRGTVALRMPDSEVATSLLNSTGPMAVSSANTSGQEPATTVDEAGRQLGDTVSVYLDAGECGAAVPSSIVDLTGSAPRLLRAGVLTVEALREVAPDLEASEARH